MSTPSRRVFISRVSREFGKIAEDLRSTLQAVGESGRTQISFRQEEDTDTTLSKLSKYIHESDVVLSLIGEYSGSYPPDASMDEHIYPVPPSGSAARTWRQLIPAGLDRLSYTQWEVILARFWKKSLFLYFGRGHAPDQSPPTKDDDLPHQQEFIAWLTKERGMDREYFENGDQLEKRALRDLWPPARGGCLGKSLSIQITITLAAVVVLLNSWYGSKNILPTQINGRTVPLLHPPLPPPLLDLVIDAGHGGDDAGTSGNGALEKDYALSIALAVAEQLEKNGRKVTLTRSKDETVEIDARWMLANIRQASAFISIHFNADGNSDKSHGIETFYTWPRKPDTMLSLQTALGIPTGSTFTDHRSRLLAEHIQRGLIAATGAQDRGVKNRADLAVTSRTVMPSVLVECGFLSNAAECALIEDKSYREKIVTGIINGVESWLMETASPGSGIEITTRPAGAPEPPTPVSD